MLVRLARIAGQLIFLRTEGRYRIFKQNLVRTARERLDFGKSTVRTADEVAEIILKAATTEQPDTRYHAGLSSKLTAQLRGLLPDRVFDAAVSRMVPMDQLKDD